MYGEIREWLISRRSTIGLRIFKRDEVEEVKESREKDVVVGEEEIRMRKQYQPQLLSHYEGMSRLSNDKWLFIVLNPSPAAPSEAN